MATKARAQIASSAVVRIIFLALLLDLLAFTIPLPLFPRLIDGFVRSEAESHSTFAGSLERLSPSADASTPNSTLLSHTLHFVRTLRQTLFSYSSLGALTPEANARWDLTLLGGLLASLFSLCQFIISPRMGALSDKYGRRNVLLASMVGNLVSALLWVCSGSFGVYAGECARDSSGACSKHD